AWRGAAISGCETIIAIDTRPAPLEIARRFGATQAIEAEGKIVDTVRMLTAGRGADFVFDTVGNPRTLTDGLAMTRKGGTVVLTGLARGDTQAAFPTFPFVMQEKRLIGSVYGSGRPSRDTRKLDPLYQDGRLKWKDLVSRTYTLSRVNDALDALASSDGARGVITW